MALRWLLLIPFACLVAMGSGLFFLTAASIASPAVALLIGGGIERLLDIVFGLAESGVDPTPAAQAALALIARLGLSIIVVPVVLVAIGSELFRLRGLLVQSGLTGLLAALLPLAMLSAGAIFAGYAFKEYFVGHDFEHFWKSALFMGKDNHILHAMHEVPKWVVWSPFAAMVIGFALAYWMYVRRPDIPGRLAAANPALYQFLLNKWYFDEIYDFLFVRPAKWLGRFLWKKGDGFVIDGFGPDGVSARVVDVTNRVVRLQTGYLYHYAFAMLIGVAGLVTWYLLTRG